jgi:chromosomal replication initiation ATPase DnaA
LQLSFDFPFEDKYLIEDFIVSSSNQFVFNFIRNYNIDDTALPKIFAIIAPELAGKTYLSNIWQKKLSAEFLDLDDLIDTNLVKFIQPRKYYIIEDIDKIKNNELLLEIFNIVQAKYSFLLLTSSVNLNQVGLKVKDLNSRLKNVFELSIVKPDDDLIKMLLIKNFAEKQLLVSDKVVNFLIKNLHRSFSAIFDIVKLLEFYSLEKKRKITTLLAKEVLKKSSN